MSRIEGLASRPPNAGRRAREHFTADPSRTHANGLASKSHAPARTGACVAAGAAGARRNRSAAAQIPARSPGTLDCAAVTCGCASADAAETARTTTYHQCACSHFLERIHPFLAPAMHPPSARFGGTVADEPHASVSRADAGRDFFFSGRTSSQTFRFRRLGTQPRPGAVSVGRRPFKRCHHSRLHTDRRRLNQWPDLSSQVRKALSFGHGVVSVLPQAAPTQTVAERAG